MKQNWQIVLADDMPFIRSALRLLLEQEPGITIACETADSSTTLHQVATLTPDILLLDWELPGADGVSFIHSLLQTRPNLRIIALSSRPEAKWAAGEAGVYAFVSKGDPPDYLLSVIRNIQTSCHNLTRKKE